MSATLLALYPWIKAIHVIAVISWMAGLLYLPRLFVYHCEAEAGSAQSETFKVMEEKLARIIMRPAMWVSLALGLALIAIPGTPGHIIYAGPWLWLKLVLVVALVAVHFAMMGWRRDFAEDRNERPQRFFRIANEIPTLLMIGIVICVIVKPF
ncbi:MAG: protoporphyrinogen oxidase HemJ [Deltaproteobacteria bacterium]|jgi:putative membrane protein|nr:protoporphyrinogen oxidase HemJ [Deltaproteobacteria bacterium]